MFFSGAGELSREKNNWRFVTSSVLFRLMRTFFIMLFLIWEVHRHLFQYSQICSHYSVFWFRKTPISLKKKQIFTFFGSQKLFFPCFRSYLIIYKRLQLMERYSFPQNIFYCQWSLQRPLENNLDLSEQ